MLQTVCLIRHWLPDCPTPFCRTAVQSGYGTSYAHIYQKSVCLSHSSPTYKGATMAFLSPTAATSIPTGHTLVPEQLRSGIGSQAEQQQPNPSLSDSSPADVCSAQQHEARITALEKTQADLQEQLNFQHEHQLHIVDGLERVETQLRMWAGCNAKTSQATQQVAGLGQELDRSVQKLEGAISGLQDDVRVLQRDMQGVKRDLQEVKSSVLDLQGGFSAMKADMQQFKGIVGGLRGDVRELQADMHELKGTVSGLQEKVDRLEVKVDGLKGEIVAEVTQMLDQKVDDLKCEIVAEVTTAMGQLLDEKVAAIINAATAAASRSNSSGLKLSGRFFKKGTLQRQAESVCRVS